MVLSALAVFLHVRWYTVDKSPGPEVLSGFGAALVGLGALVALRPYFRAGFAGLVQAGLPVYGAGFWSSEDTLQAHRERVAAERPRVVLDVLAERVIAVVVVILGTLLNGYGPLVARMLHLRGS